MVRDCWRIEKSKNSFLPWIKKHEGFTLIGILISVGIIIILTGIALVQFQKALNKAKVNKAEAEIEMMGRATEQIEEDTGNYIENLDQLDGSTPPDDSFSSWWGPYVSSLPLNIEDPWGTSYIYFFWVTEKKRKKEFQIGNYSSGPSGKGYEKGKKIGWKDKPLPPGLWEKLGTKKDLPEKGFLILSAGPDGEVGTQDDIIYGTY